MKKKKNKSWLVFGIIIILVLILIVLISSIKNNSVNTKLDLNEKKWIENNKKDVINVSIVNNIPVFSNDGEGVFFNFIKTIENKTNLSFNEISYEVSSDVVKNDLYFEVIKKSDAAKLKDDSMVFYKDYYVLVSKNAEKIGQPKDISDKKIGVLKDDLADVSFYLPSDGNTYTPYENDADLEGALDKDEINYIAVPKTRYYSYILSKNYHIVYNMTELKEAYVLKTAKSTNKYLVSIIKKNYLDYKANKLDKEYNNYLNDYLLTENNISEKSKADFLAKKYTFGYITNEPYTNMINNKLIGLDSTYLNDFASLSGADFSYKKYNTVSSLNDALNNGEIDFASNYYNYPELTGEYSKTISPFSQEFVVLVDKNRTDLVVNSIKSLKNKEVVTANTNLATYLKKEGKAKVTTYDKVKTLLKKMNKDDIVVIDKEFYDLNNISDFKDYRVVYSDKEDLNHGFIISKSNENETFIKLFSNYLETSNYKQNYNKAWKEYYGDSKEIDHTFIYFIVGLFVIVVIWIFAKKKLKIKKITRREQVVRFVDPLTSLKNRHYLNKNFSKWENNSIYPQSIIVINLNNLRHINDVYGHEEGDKLIKQAANILIKNQLEQSDIIRTDGNEYLIYMVGYEKNKVVTYMRKLYKELGELPYGFGATLGYSMIEDDIKTIDDAINEAVLEIRANKEMKNKK